MKLSLGFAAACAGLAAARPADVYLINGDKHVSTQQTAREPASISSSLARLIFLQRLSAAGKGPSTQDVTDGTSLDDIVAALNSYGKAPPSILTPEKVKSPQQVLVLIEDMQADQISEFEGQVANRWNGMKQAFKIQNPPATQANGDLTEIDFFNAGVATRTDCDFDAVVDPENKGCWDEKAREAGANAARFNAAKDTKQLGQTKSVLQKIEKLVQKGNLEVMLVVLPASEDSSPSSWSPEKLHRRQSEEVMSAVEEEDTEKPAAQTASAQDHPLFLMPAAHKNLASCYDSKDSCVSATGNCSGHGECQNRYRKSDGSDGKDICYSCHCLSTVSESGSLTHWAGAACQKKDVSTPFWLFAGFTILLLGILTMAIGMLFSVGEEKLPGVIGAGVSRSK